MTQTFEHPTVTLPSIENQFNRTKDILDHPTLYAGFDLKDIERKHCQIGSFAHVILPNLTWMAQMQKFEEPFKHYGEALLNTCHWVVRHRTLGADWSLLPKIKLAPSYSRVWEEFEHSIKGDFYALPIVGSIFGYGKDVHVLSQSLANNLLPLSSFHLTHLYVFCPELFDSPELNYSLRCPAEHFNCQNERLGKKEKMTVLFKTFGHQASRMWELTGWGRPFTEKYLLAMLPKP